MRRAFRTDTWGWWSLAALIVFLFFGAEHIRAPMEWVWETRSGRTLFFGALFTVVAVAFGLGFGIAAWKSLFKGDPQPGRQLYAMDSGWRVMRQVVADYSERVDLAKEWWWNHSSSALENAELSDNLVGMFLWYCVTAGHKVAGAAQKVLMYVAAIPFFVLYLAILSAMYLANTVSILIFRGFDRVYRWRFRTRYTCPHCYHTMNLPVFVCSNLVCRARHTRLAPNEYGVLRHDCSCGVVKLSTLDRLGRKKLDRRCARCDHPLNAEIGARTNYHIPVVGGVSAGKSSLIQMATNDLLNRAHTEFSATIRFIDRNQQNTFEKQQRDLASGNRLPRTTETTPSAFNLSITNARQRVGKLVYFYDAAGEAWDNSSLTEEQHYFQQANGLMMVVDPFAIPRFASLFGADLGRIKNELGASESDIEGVYRRAEEHLSMSGGIGNSGSKHSLPFAVVLNKADAMGLEEVIGPPAVNRLRSRSTEFTTDQDAMDEVIKQFLSENGLKHIVDDIDTRFSNVRYFSCSALGRLPDNSGRPFQAIRAGDPLVWLMEQNDILRRRALGT